MTRDSEIIEAARVEFLREFSEARNRFEKATNSMVVGVNVEHFGHKDASGQVDDVAIYDFRVTLVRDGERITAKANDATLDCAVRIDTLGNVIDKSTTEPLAPGVPDVINVIAYKIPDTFEPMPEAVAYFGDYDVARFSLLCTWLNSARTARRDDDPELERLRSEWAEAGKKIARRVGLSSWMQGVGGKWVFERREDIKAVQVRVPSGRFYIIEDGILSQSIVDLFNEMCEAITGHKVG